jgi:para-nitrobenzyl esterase
MLRKSLTALLVACALLSVLATTASAHGVVRTDKGPVRGLETPALNKYLGIPYAAPPVGDLRWRPPQSPVRWRDSRDATKFANHCPQDASPFGFESRTEDCLYLNVFTPGTPARSWRSKGQKRHKGHKRHKRHRHDEDRPVMVWLHGGGLTVGESDDYDPTRLVRQGVVVVTINYRLGYLGFLAHPALSAESGGRGSGNYGLMDQQAALRWVQRNIERFGGDDDNVTIFGQSAGGLSVHSQLASPRGKGLFDRAIAQSGAYASEIPSLAAAETSGAAAATNFGCPGQSAACLRSASLEAILAVQPTTAGAIVPNVDGTVLPESIGSAIESGNFNRVPVIEGSTHDEFTIFEVLYVESLVGAVTPTLYPAVVGILDSTLGLAPTPEEILAQYPLTDYPSPGLAISAIGTDAIFACPARKTAGALSRFVRTYQYELADPNVPQLFDVPLGSIPFGSYHAADLPYLFDSDLRGGHAPFSAEQEALAAAMVGYWTRFAKAGTPNRRGLPQWPGYTTASDTHMSFVPPTPQAKSGFAADHKCAFWDSFAGSS